MEEKPHVNRLHIHINESKKINLVQIGGCKKNK